MDPERVRLANEKSLLEKFQSLAKEANAIAKKNREEARANDVTINPPLTRSDYRDFRRQNDRVLRIRISNARLRKNVIVGTNYRRNHRER